MLKTVRILLCWLLVMATALEAPLSHAAAAQRLAARTVLLAQSAGTQRIWTNIKVAGSSAELRTKAAGLMAAPFKGVASAVLNDVFQAALIMAAAAVAQLAKDRMDRNQLLAGHKLNFADVQKETTRAAEDLICASSAKGASVSSEIACSGELWAGFFGGMGVRAAAQITVIQILKLLLKSNPTRAAIISTVGTFATSFLMLSGFQMSSYLWTQSVQVMNDKDKEERAHNLFGRAASQWLSGNWESYTQTEDGRLAAEVFENMQNILLLKKDMRASWVYNAWRFGLARGEMIMNLTVLIGALSAGTAIGASLAGIVGLAGWPATAVTFLIASALGAVVSAAIVYLPDAHVGENITALIQNIRGLLADSSHGLTRYHLGVSAQAFDLNRFQERAYQHYRRRWEFRLRYLMPQLTADRVSGINIAFEKYHELQAKVEQAEATLNIAQEVVNNSNLREKLLLADGQTVMTYAQAKQKYCTARRCDFPLAYQLQKIAEAKMRINEGRAVLQEIAAHVLKKYDDDAKAFQDILDNVNLQFPPDIAAAIKDENERLTYLSDALAWNFAALHPEIRKARQLEFDSEDELKLMKMAAKDLTGRLYIHGMNEREYLEKLKIANP